MREKNKNIATPFVPGDDLYYVVTGKLACPGPGIFEIKLQKNGIGSIQVDADGDARIVNADTGTAELPDGQWTCLDEAAALDWARKNLPGAVRLGGESVTAVYAGPDGTRKAVSFGCTLSELEDLVCSKPCTMDPDGYGILAIYDAGATRDTSPFMSFLNDAAGRPVDVIYGPHLLIGVEKDPETGFYVPKDVPPELLAALEGRSTGAGDGHAYDPAFWTEGVKMTVSMLRDYLSKIPDDAVVCCCGTDPVYLHYCPAANALSMDCESLEDLPEYEGRAPAVRKGTGA